MLGVGQFERFGAFVCLEHLVSAVAQQGTDQLPVGGAVIDDQDGGHSQSPVGVCNGTRPPHSTAAGSGGRGIRCACAWSTSAPRWPGGELMTANGTVATAGSVRGWDRSPPP